MTSLRAVGTLLAVGGLVSVFVDSWALATAFYAAATVVWCSIDIARGRDRT